MQVGVLAAYPVFQHILQLEWILAQLLLGCLGILLVEVENLLLGLWLYRHILIGS